MRKIKDGLKKRGGVLAMYDISIRAGGKKWQPDAGDPVRVTVELDEPVVATSSSLGVAHLADDGTVEELRAAVRAFAEIVREINTRGEKNGIIRDMLKGAE